MFLSEKQIKDYQTDGVIIVKDIFKKPSFHVAWQAKDYLKKIELFKL